MHSSDQMWDVPIQPRRTSYQSWLTAGKHAPVGENRNPPCLEQSIMSLLFLKIRNMENINSINVYKKTTCVVFCAKDSENMTQFLFPGTHKPLRDADMQTGTWWGKNSERTLNAMFWSCWLLTKTETGRAIRCWQERDSYQGGKAQSVLTTVLSESKGMSGIDEGGHSCKGRSRDSVVVSIFN